MKNNLNYFYNSKLLLSTLVLLIIIGIFLFIINLFQSNSKFKMKFYAKGHIDKLSGQFNIENFTDSNKWIVKIPSNSMNCPGGTNKTQKFGNEICCTSYEPTSSKYKSLNNSDYGRYIVDSCDDCGYGSAPEWQVKVPNGVTMECPPGTAETNKDAKGKICIGFPKCNNDYKELSACYVGFNQVVGLL